MNKTKTLTPQLMHAHPHGVELTTYVSMRTPCLDEFMDLMNCINTKIMVQVSCHVKYVSLIECIKNYGVSDKE